MTGAGTTSRKLSICVLLLSLGCRRLQADSTSSNISLQGTLLLDLNTTVFINTIILNTTFGNHEFVDLDIGTESCDLFDDKACYITCSSRELVQSTVYYVTMNVTCDVDNVKGRYVRVRHNTTGLHAPCDVKVIGWPDLGKAFKNFALNAPCIQSTTSYNGAASRAVDGNRDGHWSDYSCTHTDFSNDLHWWQVDLGKLILLSHIIIANRMDYCCTHRLANFTVELGRLESNDNITYTLCHYYDGVAGPLTTLNCTRSIWGRFVRISQVGEPLTLCEVEVYSDTDDNITRPVSVLSDNMSDTWLATSNMTTWTIKCTFQGTTESKFLDVTSKAQASTGNLNTKVSTMYSEITTKAKVSTAYPELTTAARVSTMTQEITTKAKGSTVAAEVTTKASVSTVYLGLTTRAKASTMNSEIATKAKVSSMNPETSNKAEVSSVTSKVTTKAQVSTVYPELTTKAKVSTMNQEITTKAKESTELTTKAKVSTRYPIVVTEAELYTEKLQDSQMMTGTPQMMTATPQITTATPKEYSYCTCKCWEMMTKNQEEVHQKMMQTTKSLKMKHSALGKQVRKKSSAADQRLSSTAMGIVCTIAFFSIFIFIVLCDFYRLCQYLLKK